MAPRKAYAFGVKLMERAMTDSELTPVQRAVEFRDGRRSDMVRIIVGEHRRVTVAGYAILTAGDEGKTRRRLELTLPHALGP